MGSANPEVRESIRRARKLAEQAKAEEQQGALDRAVAGFQEALEALPSDEPTALRADLLRWLGTAHRHLAQNDLAESCYEDSLALAEALDYRAGKAHAQNCLAILSHRKGDLEEARKRYRQAARLAQEAGEHRLTGMIEQNLGVLSNMKGDLDGALVRYRAALQAFESAGDQEGVSWVLNNMGMLHIDLEQFDEADHMYRRGLAIARDRGDLHMVGLYHLNRAELHIARGEYETAETECQLAREIAEERGDPLRLADASRHLAVVRREQDRLEDSMRLLTGALSLATGGEDSLLVAEIRRELGDTHLEMGDTEEARAQWTRALEGFKGLDAVRDSALVEERLAALAGARE